MYCSQCGQSIGGLPQCPQCGAATGVAGLVGAPYSKVAKHLRVLGILWTIFAVYSVLQWLVLMPFLHMWMGGRMWMPGPEQMGYGPFHPGGWLLQFIGIAVVVRALLSMIVGIALVTRQPWGRIFAIIIAILTLIKPFLGTALAIYTLWVLLGRNADIEHERLAATRQQVI